MLQIDPFSAGVKVLRFLFRLLGVPDPWFSIDGILVKVFAVVCVIAIPYAWIASGLDLLGKLLTAGFLLAIYMICVAARRSEIRKLQSQRTERDG